MLRNLQKNNQSSGSGFTIIEVLIVLAIAGLIMLIVFLAVPALQRNSRNTQRKNDVSAVLGAVSEYESNNNGALPVTCSGTTPAVIGGGAGVTTAQAKVGYYSKGCVTAAPASGNVELVAGAVAALPGTAAGDYLVIATGTSCNGAAAQAGAARGVTALYEVESGSGNFTAVCQES